jgi:hypothetical protein
MQIVEIVGLALWLSPVIIWFFQKPRLFKVS